ncbi:hypothetical protein ES703_118922 [subsurface metagenome]
MLAGEKISYLNIVAEATVGIAQGISSVARANPRPLNFLFKINANDNPNINSMLNDTTEKKRV